MRRAARLTRAVSLARLRHTVFLCALTGLLACAPTAWAADGMVRYYGEASSAAGAALAQGACDVNGDGYADAIAGAWFWDKLPTASSEGTTHVVFGGPEPQGGDLSSSRTAAVQLDGAEPGDLAGFSVGCAGDVNGDGLDDVLVGAYIQETAYVIFGAVDFGPIDLRYLGERGYRIRGDLDLDQNVGFAVAGVGDVDGDGLDDVAVGAVVADTLGRTNNGRIYVVPGQASTKTVDVTQPSSSIMILEGSAAEERLGSVAPAGDVDGDGTGDIVVGSFAATPHGPAVAVAGAAWVVSGAVRGTLDLAAFDDEGFKIVGPTRARDRLGISVDGAGDVNGDGLDDLLLGGDGVTNPATGPRTGSAWVVFGSTSHETVDAGNLEATGRGYWIRGAVQGDATGYSVANIGDRNGDGRADAAIGAYGYDPVDPANPAARLSGAGAAYVVYGKTGTAPIELATLTPEVGYRIDGIGAGDRFGRQVAAVGDLDANGAADFAVGGDFAVREGRTQAGEVAFSLAVAPAAAPVRAPGLPLVRAPEVVTAASTGGKVAITLVCPADLRRCTGTAGLRSALPKPGATDFDLAPGTSAAVDLRLKRKADGRLEDEIVVTARGPGGTTLRLSRGLVVLSDPGVPPSLAPRTASARSFGLWSPSGFDTCPQELHDRFVVIGRDGKRYPTWHPATIVDPKTGRACSFGHEHGPDPRGSDLYDWASAWLSAGKLHYTGVPFGSGSEALDAYSASHPDMSQRHEDHVGHKIGYVNDVALLERDGTPLGASCDFLFKLHQGSHSPDALANNVHELVYAVKCTDGLELISTTMATFGAPNEFHRACAPDIVQSAGTALAYPAGPGARLIPDRMCVEQQLLVPASRGSALWGLYENWRSENALVAADGRRLAFFDPDFAIFDPSRYAAAAGTQAIRRVSDLCWEVEPNGDRMNREPCTLTVGGPFSFDDPRAPFKGARREVYLGQTTVANGGGPTVWHTDPFGGNGSTSPFPGSIRQHVSSFDNAAAPPLQRRLFGRGTDHGGTTVHSPN